jgi:amino acid transporter
MDNEEICRLERKLRTLDQFLEPVTVISLGVLWFAGMVIVTNMFGDVGLLSWVVGSAALALVSLHLYRRTIVKRLRIEKVDQRITGG